MKASLLPIAAAVVASSAALTASYTCVVAAFTLSPPKFAGTRQRHCRTFSYSNMKLSAATADKSNFLTLELEKPLGMILEEVEENAAMGVKVQEISDGGSASSSPHANDLPGMKLVGVMGDDVSRLTFDDVMSKIIDAPSPVSIEFLTGHDVAGAAATGLKEAPGEAGTADDDASDVVTYDVGTPVTITVIQEGKDTASIEARVGDNLRRTLLDNGVELYRGLKKKMGNCGGAGQCTYCAVDFVDQDGWEPRSEYEEGKIGKWPTARLACMNNIQGPVTIRVQ